MHDWRVLTLSNGDGNRGMHWMLFCTVWPSYIVDRLSTSSYQPHRSSRYRKDPLRLISLAQPDGRLGQAPKQEKKHFSFNQLAGGPSSDKDRSGPPARPPRHMGIMMGQAPRHQSMSANRFEPQLK